jgi:cyclophilin family peptidyl-prolyl cis-trans isomerase
MYKFLIPLFALALLVGCTGAEDTNPTVPAEGDATGFTGKILSGKHTVILHTSMGDVTMKLDAKAAPKTVTNFVALAQTGFYDGLIFHRVIPSFMLQGGDPNGNGTGGSSVFGDVFEDEINAESYGLHKTPLSEVAGTQELPPELENMTVKEYYELQGYKYNDSLKSISMERGVIAMANRGPNTNGSQFFIIQAEEGTPWLEGKHTVFGKVTDGMEIVDAISQVERDANDMPREPVTFTVEVK